MKLRLSPEQQKKLDERAKKQEAYRQKMASIFGTAFSTPEGMHALRYIMNICGYQDSVVGANPDLGMDIMQGTLHNGARRNIYLELRKMIPSHILKQVEFKQGDE